MGGGEEGSSGSFDEGDERNRPEGDPIEQDRRGKTPNREDTDAVGRDHQPLAIPAVRRKAGRQCEQGRRQCARE